MRQSIRIASTLLVFAAGSAISSARADEWCGYTAHDNAIIECGYTTVAGCESVVGKGGMCFVDPDTASNIRRATPIDATKPQKVFDLETGRG
jgi:hypothetical protein